MAIGKFPSPSTWTIGAGGGEHVMAIPFTSPGLPESIDPRVSTAWKGVSCVHGTPVTAVIAKERVGNWVSGEAVLVSTIERDSSLIHQVFSVQDELSSADSVAYSCLQTRFPVLPCASQRENESVIKYAVVIHQESEGGI